MPFRPFHAQIRISFSYTFDKKQQFPGFPESCLFYPSFNPVTPCANFVAVYTTPPDFLLCLCNNYSIYQMLPPGKKCKYGSWYVARTVNLYILASLAVQDERLLVHAMLYTLRKNEVSCFLLYTNLLSYVVPVLFLAVLICDYNLSNAILNPSWLCVCACVFVCVCVCAHVCVCVCVEIARGLCHLSHAPLSHKPTVTSQAKVFPLSLLTLLIIFLLIATWWRPLCLAA